MKLSVIIVNWNTKELTRQTIQTTRAALKDSASEIIVIDNHSSDGSVDMIRQEFPQVRLVVNETNLGFAKANNQGLKLAQGTYLMVLNSDTIVAESALHSLVTYLDSHPDVALVGPRLLNADGTFQHACRRRLPNPQDSFFHLFGFSRLFPNNPAVNRYKRYTDDSNITESVEALSGAAMMFRRSLYEKIGGLDEQFFMYGEDLDFCARTAAAGGKIVYVSEVRITHLGGQSSGQRKTKSIIDFYRAMWLYYRKHFVGNRLTLFHVFIWVGIWLRCGIALILKAIS